MEQKQESVGATMRDVAEKAGVSTATVSRTLMNPDKVSASTRKKVEAAVIAVGYSPHSMTRNARRNESRVVLVIVPDICDPFFSEIIRGIELVAAERGYLVLIGDCAHQRPHEHAFLNLMTSRQIDGVIILGSQLPFESSVEARQNMPPMVMAHEFAPELELPSVHIDNLTAAFEAVNHLLKLGHSRIACIAGPHHMPLCHYRLQGYIQALQRHGIALEPRYIVRGDFTFDAGSTAMKQLMALPAPPDALFCHSDIMALGAMSQAKNMGLRVPQDLSLIGFDDIELSRYSDPQLTTIVQPRFNIGREAMNLLLEQLQGKMVSTGSRLLDFELKVRGSTAPSFHERD
ncbi:DNA-binding transcriptional regulator CytR [Erwinia psidii]|uniref:DNA-binding transcriptional regulator CytR n=1 Tax=Erwinia psidii TaxID=69224 RepID=A0A3N6S7Q7_9GAMM|nr:DNA-binding transcriptional regulator CytR [Erwinia psidii]MCX8959196.1 DNA-binding transcriptional regulator CytR [Erwinia psidii]MCX8962185.1 DNA-binding transcriptional regulator CytR [Erwinia psidii]RQM37170.1 DNA-binding transcriptional regulator CytR [Erwinia psidii]